ncbi:DUF3489 domain-containing protein [Sphingomonas sp. 10B4]|uniref:DUF3489 domain-containing protein n=1 Tax=Sphingomonas sp. 10B4 TaxID=3048575 RepID=UPI002AB518F9|nr:DUF3489 domain-containing protein [Sphingomonas sp. 10B4]MDY7523141.1 DUF3489 domain-containing protein [Sphingomonas sp. 10B4]MEB0284612.1 DUF3489 domain-containing protein [Sphingomonas sp. 10B4]
MTKLNDMQSILLSTAGQRDSGRVYPLPDTLANADDRARKAIAALIKRNLMEDRETDDAVGVAREDGDLRYGVFITPEGRAAIGLGEGEGAGPDVTPPMPAQPKPERQTRAAMVIALLQRKDGATLAELIAATGWLPHTTRAALTGLRKKGRTIERSKRDNATCYRIVATG